MRDIRTYGLTRGCWSVRNPTADWGLLHPACASGTAAWRVTHALGGPRLPLQSPEPFVRLAHE